MAPKLYDVAAADEDQRSYAIQPVRLPVNSTTTDLHAEFDAQNGEGFSSNNNVSSESEAQQKVAKVPPRTRILSAAAELFLRYGIAGVSVEAIAKAAAAAKPTLYYHFSPRRTNSLQNICTSPRSGSMSVGQKSLPSTLPVRLFSSAPGSRRWRTVL